MDRFILRFQGKGIKPAEEIERLCKQAGARVLDDSSPRMVLVEAAEEALRAALDRTSNWVMSRERSYALPPRHPVADKTKGLKPPK